MENAVELYNEMESSDVECSRIILQVYSVAGGYLPNWHLEVREEATMEEILALRDGVELVRVQFDKMMDLLIKDLGE